MHLKLMNELNESDDIYRYEELEIYIDAVNPHRRQLLTYHFQKLLIVALNKIQLLNK